MTLGIDPGYGRLGYAFVEKSSGVLHYVAGGLIETSSKETLCNRLLHIYSELDEMIDKHSPQEAAVEKLFFAKNTKTAIDVAQARGAVLVLLARKGLRISEYTPNEVKNAVCGSGRADKQQVQRMLSMILQSNESITQDDEADAAAIAVCHENIISQNPLKGVRTL